MVDLISSIRQMMAENKFIEAEKIAEINLKQQSSQQRNELIKVYLETLNLQNKTIPENLVLELLESDFTEYPSWEKHLEKKLNSHTLKKSIIKMKYLDSKGDLFLLLGEIKKIKQILIENNKPILNEYITGLQEKYFKDDFELKIFDLVLTFLQGNLEKVEIQILNLFSYLNTKKDIKDVEKKFNLLGSIIEAQEEKKQIEIFQSYCFLRSKGIQEKKDFKKIIEILLLAQNQEMRLHVLKLLDHLSLIEIAKDYANYLRDTTRIKVVSVLKYDASLKKYFINEKINSREEIEKDTVNGDLSVIKESTSELKNMDDHSEQTITEEESVIVKSLKHQDLNNEGLVNLGIGFLQSEFFYAAKECGMLVLKNAQNEKDRLNAFTLLTESLFRLKDYRMVLNYGIEGLALAQKEEEILALLYLISESYFFLNKRDEAKISFNKIKSIRANYRNTLGRLQEMNEN